MREKVNKRPSTTHYFEAHNDADNLVAQSSIFWSKSPTTGEDRPPENLRKKVRFSLPPSNHYTSFQQKRIWKIRVWENSGLIWSSLMQ